MIEEINSKQFVAHYFEKAYDELDRSPEAFLRAALEYVQKQDGLLSQPNAIESLTRLAQLVQEEQREDSVSVEPETQHREPRIAVRDSTPSSVDNDGYEDTVAEGVAKMSTTTPGVSSKDIDSSTRKEDGEGSSKPKTPSTETGSSEAVLLGKLEGHQSCFDL